MLNTVSWEGLVMYVEHPVFIKPTDENIKIWRYMDFTKFLYLLEYKSLFFTRSDKFEDMYEGTLNDLTKEQIRENFIEMMEGKFENNLIEEYIQGVLEFGDKIKEWTTINCWHMNNFESDAMWKLYNNGIAIQSTYTRLRDSFHVTDKSVNLGMVQYIDFDTETIPINNYYYKFLTKQISFEHEKEIRAIHAVLPNSDNKLDFNASPFNFGIDIEIDLGILIEKIYIAPNSPQWIVNLIQSLLNKYELNGVPLIQSSLRRR